MASSPDISDCQKRYAVIEKAYCQARWSTVMEAGTLLLRELLEAGADPEMTALRYRMQLLVAHTLLHGYGDRDAAEDLYDVVRNSEAEPALRQIAEDGLDQCHEPLMSTLAPEEDEAEEEKPSRPLLFLPETELALLEEEEAKPAIKRSKGGSQRSQLPLGPLPNVAMESGPDEPLPEARVMVSEPDALGIAADPFNSSSHPAPPQNQERGEPVMPWLTQPSVVKDPAPAEGSFPWQVQPPTPAFPANGALIPDVVEEPELMEVHQATPSLAEEVELEVKAELPTSPHPSEPEGPGDGDLRTGLLLVVVA